MLRGRFKVLMDNGKLFQRVPPEYTKLHLNRSQRERAGGGRGGGENTEIVRCEFVISRCNRNSITYGQSDV